MSDSPRSETFPSRFSTPVNELDDHRWQSETLPPSATPSNPQSRPNGRRSTRRSTNGENAGFLSARDALRQIATHADVEHAIVDDDASHEGGHHNTVSPSAAPSPSVTFGPPRHADPEQPSHIPPLVLESSRSTSPPNSVEAFADPRQQRGRAGTAESHAPSFMSVRRSISGAPGHRNRAYSSDHGNRAESVDGDSEGSVEDDVCFPATEEPNKQYSIDYEDLEEFASTHKHTTNIPFPFGHAPNPANEEQKHRLFLDLSGRNHHKAKYTETNGLDVSEEDSSMDVEKHLSDEDFGPQSKRPPERINRWSFFSSDLEEMIHAPELCDLLMPGETFQHLFELGPEGGVWWLDMLMPTEDEVEAICKAFGIHSLTREDIVQQETREKVELFKSYYFVCFRSFYQMDVKSEHYLEPVNVYAVVFREGILTFTFCPSPHAANVRKRMSKLRDYVSLGADWICYALIDDIVDTFGPIISEVERESEAIEDNVFTARPDDLRTILRQIGDCRKTVMSLIRLIGGKADVIKGFAKRCNEQYSIAPRQDVGLYLSDIQDHVVTMMSNLGHFEKMLSRSHSNYLAQIQVDNIVQGNRVNAVLGKATFIATILVPLNLVTGLFGMNVPVPGENTDTLAWWFGILGFILCFVCTAFAIAKRMKFI